MTAVERVARAMHNDWHPEEDWDTIPDSVQGYYRRLADAAVAAMAGAHEGGTAPGLTVLGEPVIVSCGQAVFPRWVIELKGDQLRELMPGVELIAAEDVEP